MEFLTNIFERHAMRQHLGKEVGTGVWTGIRDVKFGPVARDGDSQNPHAAFSGTAGDGLKVEGVITHRADGKFVTKWDYGPVGRPQHS